MRHSRSRKHYKKSFKLKALLDECLPYPTKYPQLNSHHYLKHITKDFGLSGISDPNVYKLAIDESRILITFNTKDFRKLVRPHTPTVISLSMKLENKSADLKVCKLLKKFKPKDLVGKVWIISKEETKLLYSAKSGDS